MALNDWNGTQPKVTFLFDKESVDVTIEWTSPLLDASLNDDGSEITFSAPVILDGKKGKYTMKVRKDRDTDHLVYLHIDLEENV